MKGPKSGTFNTMYPQNMLSDALGVSISEIPYDDVNDTAEYLLEQLGTIERDLLIRRYKYQETYQHIGDEYDTFASSIRSKIQISLKRMTSDRNGLYLKYGCRRLEEGPPVVTEDTRISELDIPGSLWEEIYQAVTDAVFFSSLSLPRDVTISEDDSAYFDQYKDFLIIADITLLIRMRVFNPTTVNRIAKLMHIWGFMDDDIYGKDYDKTRMLSDWHGKDISLPVKEDQFPWNLIRAVIGGGWEMLTSYIDHIKVYDVLSSLYHVLGTLHDDREAEILLLYYKDVMTLDEIGQVFNISRVRVGDIKNKALRKLRHPSRQLILVWGYEQYIDYSWDERETYYKNIYKNIISNYENKIEDDAHDESTKSSEEMVNNPFATSIADLPLKGPIGTRIRNGLMRNGYNNVGDCVELFKTGKIINIRNIGECSIQELRNVLKCIGITDENLSSELQKE